MNLRRILSQAALVIGTLVFAIGLQAYAQTYTAPTASPPTGNAQAPLDTGSSPNIKSGPLQVNGFANIGASYFGGNVGIGTINPQGTLDVENSGGTQASICLNGICTTTSIASPALVTNHIEILGQKVCNSDSVATCPAGWLLTGGGSKFTNSCGSGNCIYAEDGVSYPVGNSWHARSPCGIMQAYAVCTYPAN